jgi:hypothetical protein
MLKWGNEELQKSINLLLSGYSYNEIGIVLNKTPRSVREKLKKNGYKSSDYKHINCNEIKFCLNCGEEIKDLKCNKRKFCSCRCSATFNNKKRKTINIKIDKKVNNKFDGSYNAYLIYIEKWKKNMVSGLRGKYQISLHIIRYLFIKFNNRCSRCGWSEKNLYTGNTPLEVEHIDGNYLNNKEENLDLICPNCHSLTPTYKGANKGNGRKNRQKYNMTN